MPESEQSTDRRRWERLPFPIPVFARGVDEQGREFLELATAFSINAGGALLATRKYLAPSTLITLEIPDAPLPKPKILYPTVRTLTARIVRVTYAERCHLCGLKFIHPVLESPAKCERHGFALSSTGDSKNALMSTSR